MPDDWADLVECMASVKDGWLRRIDSILLSPTILRVIIIAGTLYLFLNFPAVLVLGLWGTVIWIVPRAIQDRHELRHQPSQADSVMEAFAEFLEIEIAEANQKIEQLEQDLEAARRKAQQASTKHTEVRGHPIFRRVGLDKDCPRWVAECVRREYRRRLHPDTKSKTEHKKEAERRFQEAEQTFAEIWRLREF